jgi:hypothetical protein
VRKRDLIEALGPWLVWTMLFSALAFVGSRHGNIGATTTNPRGLTQAQVPPPQPAGDCRGETLEKRKKVEKQ